MTKAKIWLVDQNNNNSLLLPEIKEVSAENLIAPAQPFTINMLGTQIFEKLDNRTDNDILIRTRTVWSNYRVDRVNCWEKDFPSGEFLRANDAKDNHYENMFFTDDYLGGEISIRIAIIEVDTYDSERDQIITSFQQLYQKFGAVFPVLSPYISIGNVVFSTIKKIADLMQKDETIIEVDCDFRECKPGSNLPIGKIPLKAGTYVAFKEEFQGGAVKITSEGKIQSKGEGSFDVTNIIPSYVVFQIIQEKPQNPEYVIGQEIASLLTKVDAAKNKSSTSASIDSLSEILTGYKTIQDLDRHKELTRRKNNGTLTEFETQRLAELEEELKDIIA